MTEALKRLAADLERRQSDVEKEIRLLTAAIVSLKESADRERDTVSLKVFTYFVLLQIVGVFGITQIRDIFGLLH